MVQRLAFRDSCYLARAGFILAAIAICARGQFSGRSMADRIRILGCPISNSTSTPEQRRHRITPADVCNYS